MTPTFAPSDPITEDLVGPAVLVASPASDQVHGQVLSIAGGMTAVV